MTEDEARKKFCPFQGMSSRQVRYIADGEYEPAAKCIASDCACWVWDIQMFNPKTGKYLVAGEPYQSTDGAYETYSDRDGHCGLIRG